jgi:hypothetical protein
MSRTKTTGLIETVNLDRFISAFKEAGRAEQFSYKAKEALYNYFEQLSEDIGEPIEFDVIAICCEYTEYTSFEKLQEEYNDIKSLEDLQDRTTVIEFEGGLIIQNF